MRLFLTHLAISREPFKDDFETPACLGIHLVVDDDLRLIVGVDVSFGQTERVIQVDWQFPEYPGVVVLRYFPFLTQLDLINLQTIVISEQFLEVKEGHVERDSEFLLFGVLVDIDDVVNDDDGNGVTLLLRGQRFNLQAVPLLRIIDENVDQF